MDENTNVPASDEKTIDAPVVEETTTEEAKPAAEEAAAE